MNQPNAPMHGPPLGQTPGGVQETRNPQRLLQRVLSRLPPPIWDQPSMAGLREEAQAALARQPIDLDECEAIFKKISISR